MKRRSIKSVIGAVLVGTLLLANSMVALADPVITYTPTTLPAEAFVITGAGENNDLFLNMKGMMPGDEASNSVTLSNRASNTADFYLKAEAVSNQSALAKGLLEEITVTVSHGGRTIYSGPASGDPDMYPNVESSLETVIPIGAITSGGNSTLQITATVPTSLGNTYQNVRAEVNWVFYCVLRSSEGGYDPGVDPNTPIEDPLVPLDNFVPDVEPLEDITDDPVALGEEPDYVVIVDDDTPKRLPKTGGLTNYLDEIGLILIIMCLGLVVINRVERKVR